MGTFQYSETFRYLEGDLKLLLAHHPQHQLTAILLHAKKSSLLALQIQRILSRTHFINLSLTLNFSGFLISVNMEVVTDATRQTGFGRIYTLSFEDIYRET